MAGNWGKSSSNFGSRSPKDGRFVSKPEARSRPSSRVLGGSTIVERVSEAMRSANEKTGFVRNDAKK